MQNMVLDAIAKGGSVTNQSMNVASRMADSVQQSINSVSKIAFGVRKILMDAEADAFMKKINLAKILLEKQKEKFYELNTLSNIDYRNKSLDYQQKNLEANNAYRNRMLDFRQKQYEDNLDYKNKALALQEKALQFRNKNNKTITTRTTSTPINGGVPSLNFGGSTTNTQSNQVPNNQPQQTQIQSLKIPNFQNPTINSIAHSFILSNTKHVGDVDAMEAQLAKLNSQLANYPNKKSIEYQILSNQAKQLSRNINIAKSYQKERDNYIEKSFDNILKIKDAAGNPVYNRNTILAARTAVEGQHGKDKDIMFLSALQKLDKEASVNTQSMTDPATIIDNSWKIMNSYEATVKEKQEAKKHFINTALLYPFDINVKDLSKKINSGKFNAAEQRELKSILNMNKNAIWKDKYVQEVAGGIWQAVMGGSEDVNDKEQIVKYLIENSIKTVKKDVVSDLLRELSSNKNPYIDNADFFLNNQYGYDINIGTDTVDYEAITMATIDLLREKGVNIAPIRNIINNTLKKQKSIKKSQRYNTTFHAGATEQDVQNAYYEAFKYIQSQQKYKNLINEYVENEIPKKDTYNDLDKTMIFGYIIHPAILKYKKDKILQNINVLKYTGNYTGQE